MDRRRAEILAAARRVVLERGLANTRVADIAKATDVSGGLIHYHFATKDILLTEMMRAASTDDIRKLHDIADSSGAAVARLDALLDGFAIRYTLKLGAMTRRHFLEQARFAASREVGLDRSAFPRTR